MNTKMIMSRLETDRIGDENNGGQSGFEGIIRGIKLKLVRQRRKILEKILVCWDSAIVQLDSYYYTAAKPAGFLSGKACWQPKICTRERVLIKRTRLASLNLH